VHVFEFGKPVAYSEFTSLLFLLGSYGCRRRPNGIKLHLPKSVLQCNRQQLLRLEIKICIERGTGKTICQTLVTIDFERGREHLLKAYVALLQTLFVLTSL
jgi:hypothetical protein